MLTEIKPIQNMNGSACDSQEKVIEAEQYLAEGKWRKAEKLGEEVWRARDQGDAAAAGLLGRVYSESGQQNRAAEWFQKAVALDPADSSHWFHLALTLKDRDWKACAQAWLAGLQIDPSRLEAHLGLADALMSLELYDSALIAARQALLVDPASREAFDKLGNAAEQMGDRALAIEAYTKSLALHRDSPQISRGLAAIHKAEGNPDLASKILGQIVALHPRNADARCDLAAALGALGNRQEAIAQLREAIRLKQYFPEALSNLGSLLRSDLEFDEAERCFKRACGQKPHFAAAWNNLANLYLEQNRLQEAEHCYSKAIVSDPNYAEARTSRAMLRLLNGDLERGWEEYEWRWLKSGLQPRILPKPAWDGSSLAGKTILLHTEQGAGDTLQFIRYARLLHHQGGRVVVHCSEALRDLIGAMPEVDAVFCGQETAPQFDVHAPLMSLPKLCATRLDSIPGDVPYLRVPKNVLAPERLRQVEGPCVGIVWSGNPSHPNDRNRSIPADLFARLLAVSHAHFFSLQVGAQLPERLATNQVIDLAPDLRSYAITAACLDSMDLLITVDTSVAHLAGALGKPVWLLLPICNDFRWLRNRADSPWYPSMRLFRQSQLGDWGPVLNEVAAELQKWK
ncbi:MAG: tetratricopeptide repeat protein [Acidobacteriota bacterium]